MDARLRYRGTQVTDDDIAFINHLIATRPEDSRGALSQRLCEAWDWVQRNGRLRDMVCRGLMLDQHHCLGYCHPVGEQLKYVAFGDGRAIACLAFSSPPRHIGCRHRFIGWNVEQRKRNIRLIAYNTRFLILPWVRVRHLASHLLSRTARRVKEDWQGACGHPIHLLTTFWDTYRFAGTYVDSYRLEAPEGSRAVVSLESDEFDTMLMLVGEAVGMATNDEAGEGSFADENDDTGDSTSSEIEYTFDHAGMLRIVATAFGAGETGSYRLSIEPVVAPAR